MKYVDVILPLPLDGLFTYAVADDQAARLKPGMRVVVPLGRSKTYVGIAVKVKAEKPSFAVKEIIALPDDDPTLLPDQLRLWQWISDYYMAPLGDVMKAALPSGLKAEEGYRPKMETYVGLAPAFQQPQALHVALDMLRRAHKQSQLLSCFLQLSRAKEALDGKADVQPVTREELLNASHATTAALRALLDRNILYTYQREVGRLNVGGEPHLERIHPLSEPQSDAYNQLLLQLMKKNVVLLHGVTSSGKTEIYMQRSEKTLQEGKQVLYLLPEIALTVQIMQRLQHVFGRQLGIYHSKYSDEERVEMWRKMLSADPYDIILGARSAVFLPFQRLGLVIIDEEHETSFKQQDPAPRYHARSAAIVLAQMAGAKTVLGTATPSLESYYNARTGKYGLVSLTTRFKGIALPRIEVVDIKDLRHRKMMTGPFSPQLLAAMRDALAGGQQVILFQNRRGFAPMIECPVCGWTPKCHNCDVGLTYHKRLGLLTCHYCGTTYRLPTACPNCGSTELRSIGYGTEKIEDLICQLFPEARVARMDLDTTRTRNAYERLIADFATGRTNVLIGTQMISKGLDFDKVAVVGILDADSMLNYPDFRAYEHAFMMMSQVAGRAGRKGKQGLVILQTKSPDLPVITQVVHNDYQGFFSDLLEERRLFHYPPFYHLVYVYLRHRQEPTVEHAAAIMGSQLRQWFGARVLGPDKPAVARVKAMSIRKMVLKLENGLSMAMVRRYLKQAAAYVVSSKEYATVQIYFDVDPL